MANQERTVIFHIPKTAGQSARDYVLRNEDPARVLCFYPGDGGLYRASDRIATPSATKSRLREAIGRFPLGRWAMRTYYEVRKHRATNVDTDWGLLNTSWSVLIGHFKPDQLPSGLLESSKLVTFVRPSLPRARSHFAHIMRDVAGQSKEYPWITPTMTEDAFVLAEPMRNFQSRWIAPYSVGDFAFVGTSDHMQEFADWFRPGGVMMHLNRGRTPQHELAEQTVRRFRELNRADDALVDAVSAIRPVRQAVPLNPVSFA